MNFILNKDFIDLIRALNHSEVEYLIVGGYSVIIHGYNRTTGDLDIWVNKTEDNSWTPTHKSHPDLLKSSLKPWNTSIFKSSFIFIAVIQRQDNSMNIIPDLQILE